MRQIGPQRQRNVTLHAFIRPRETNNREKLRKSNFGFAHIKIKFIIWALLGPIPFLILTGPYPRATKTARVYLQGLHYPYKDLYQPPSPTLSSRFGDRSSPSSGYSLFSDSLNFIQSVIIHWSSCCGIEFSLSFVVQWIAHYQMQIFCCLF